MPGVASATIPVAPVFKSPPVRFEMVRFEVEAREDVMTVVEAYGMVSADDAGAEKEMVGLPPTANPEPVTEIPVPEVKVEVATLWRPPVPAP